MKLIKYFTHLLNRKKKQLTQQEAILSNKIERIISYKPHNISFFVEAFTLKSSKKKSNFERLEFLGDSVLGSIMSDYLFHKYHEKDEGFLTQLKSKIVNRQNLNSLGEKLELKQLITNPNNQCLSSDISGNLFEALIGAIYLDVGYVVCKQLVLTHFINDVELLKLENKIISYKAFLMQTCQQQKVDLKMEIEVLDLPNQVQQFRSKIFVDGHLIANATELSKKKAEEKACRRTYYYLVKSERLHFENQ